MLRELKLDHISALQEHLAWNYSAFLTALSFKWDGASWLAMVKADFSGVPKVSFVDTSRLKSAYAAVAEFARTKKLSWSLDKYPPKFKRRRKPRFIYHS